MVKNIWNKLNHIGIGLYFVMIGLGVIHMITKSWFEGFTIATISLIMIKITIGDLK